MKKTYPFLFHSSFILFLFLFQLTVSSPAQSAARVLEPGKVEPEAAGFSTERLKRIDDAIKGWIGKDYMNGCAALIIRDGKIAYYKSFGYTKPNKKGNIDKDDIFRIASQTKAITSVAVMMLYEEGKLLLRDPVSKYIPEFANAKVIEKFNLADTTYTTRPAKREVTIHDLLTHTSGIGYAQIGSKEANAMYAKNGVIGGIGVGKILLADKMKILATLPLFHDPGAEFTYGLNTDVLGYLVEVVSGMSLAEFFSKRIFEPLGMRDTYFYLPSSKTRRLLPLFSEENGKLKETDNPYKLNGDFNPDFPADKGTYYSGGGGLSGTIFDYAIFLQMLLNGGEYNGVRILSPTSVRLMTMNQIKTLSLGNGAKFGLGFGITTEESSSFTPLNIGSYEWGGMFASTYWADPKEKLIGLFYRNIYPTTHGNLADYFKILTYQALVK